MFFKFIVVVFVLLNTFISAYMVYIPSGLFKFFVFSMHKTIGFVLFFMILYFFVFGFYTKLFWIEKFLFLFAFIVSLSGYSLSCVSKKQVMLLFFDVSSILDIPDYFFSILQAVHTFSYIGMIVFVFLFLFDLFVKKVFL